MDPRALQYYQYLISKGEPPHVAAALVGNIGQESSFNPMTVGDGGHSIGLFQFHSRGEQPAFRSWASQNSRDINDPYAQIDFVRSRLSSPAYASTYQRMMSAPDAATATNAFMSGYERPHPKYANLSARTAYANQVLGAKPPPDAQPDPNISLFANNAPAAPTATPPASVPQSTFPARPDFVSNNTFPPAATQMASPSLMGGPMQAAMGLLSQAVTPAPQMTLLPAQAHRGTFNGFGLLGNYYG